MLPHHEKRHLKDREAAQKSMHRMVSHLMAHAGCPDVDVAPVVPYLRAGHEAIMRGEDFYGGSDLYDKQLAALKRFYAQPKRSSETQPLGARRKFPGSAKLPGLK